MATNLYLQGLGGGTMQSYLDATCPASQLLTVEASPGVLEAARALLRLHRWRGEKVNGKSWDMTHGYGPEYQFFFGNCYNPINWSYI